MAFTCRTTTASLPATASANISPACARDYAATGSTPTQEKVQRLVRGYAPAISPQFYDGNRFPAYTYDKISIGLLDAHQFAGDPNALKTLDCRTRRGAASSAAQGSLARRAVCAPARGRVLLLGRDLHAAGEFLHRLQARRREPLSRSRRPLPRRRMVLQPAGRGPKRAAAASTPTAT